MPNNIEYSSRLEKYASEAYSLALLKQAELEQFSPKQAEEQDDAQTYAGEAFKKGIIGGAAVGSGKHLYNWAAKGIKPTLGKSLKGGIATAALWGIGGGLIGGAIKRKPVQEQPYYGQY